MSAQKPSEYLISSGDEPRVYQAFSTDDLMGYHGGLMARQLTATDEVRYMLYSPIMEGESTPFGFIGEAASHGLAVTDSRFIITRNRHVEGVSLTATSIPFSKVLRIDLGEAHMMGWLAIRFADRGKAATKTILHKTTGAEFFAEAIGEYRKAIHPGIRHLRGQDQAGWGHSVGGTTRAQRLLVRLQSFALDGERLFDAIYCRQAWTSVRRLIASQRRALTGEGVLVVTDLAVLRATREPDAKPGVRSYGINFTFIGRHVVRAAELASQSAGGKRLSVLRLVLAAGGAEETVEAPFDDACRPQAQQIIGRLAGSNRHD